MKKLFFALAATSVLAAACTKKDSISPVQTFSPGEPVTLSWKQTALLEPDQLSITFEKVSEDSRCPTNVECFWEGRAVVEFTFAKGRETVTVRLATLSSMSTPSVTTTVFGRQIKLQNVAPYPEWSTSIPEEDYEVTILVN